jgi:selenocysteine-specific elongation factor
VHVVATAGHVDHGKSSLVLALTGTDPDRWAEEKARGLTIDLGFAAATLPSGREISIVDVPGHVRFLKNMLAGVGTVDACVFVVSATEGWKPQSEEHLRILELVGVTHGVVALTKTGLADTELVELARADIEDHVTGTFLEGAEIIGVDSLSGAGLDDLRDALDRLLTTTPVAPDVARPRLWVDRSFAAKGAGTVVTGTLLGGTIHVDDELLVLPSSRQVRVRALQTFHRDRSAVEPGSRVALNLVGIARDEVGRGDVVVAAGQWHTTARVDASIDVLASLRHVVSRRGAYLAYIGAREVPVRVRVLGPESVHPGRSGLVRLHLATPLPLLPGDRYVLRESGRDETVGGGEILDVAPVLPASRAVPDRSVDRVIAERGWIEVSELRRLTGVERAPTLGHWAVDPDALERTVATLRERIATAGPLGLDAATLDERQRAALGGLDDVVVIDGHVRVADRADPLDDHPFVAACVDGGFSPPDPTGVDRAEVRALVRSGRLVDAEGILFAPSAIAAAARLCGDLADRHAEGFTVSDFRVAAETSRKYAVPLLTHLDSIGVTRRREERRIAGPRLRAVADG